MKFYLFFPISNKIGDIGVRKIAEALSNLKNLNEIVLNFYK